MIVSKVGAGLKAARTLLLAVILGLALGSTSCQQAPQELHIYTWDEYIDPEIYKLFEKEFGVKVIEDNYGSNEELLAKLQAGATGYDIIVPSDYMVAIMIKQGLLAELDFKSIPNFKHIYERFKDPPYDPGNKYSVPYLWGTTGIGYNKKEVDPPPTSWADLFEPARLEKYKNRVSMLDDPREAIGAALKYLGHSFNTPDPDKLEQAKLALLTQKPYLAKYDSEAFEDSLAAGETVIAHGWSGEIAIAKTQNPDIEYVLPQEGVVIWTDNLAIPKTSKNKELAERFINFLLKPEISAMISNFTYYASPNETAQLFIKPQILNGPSYYLPEGVNLEWIEDIGEATKLYDRIWTEIKAR